MPFYFQNKSPTSFLIAVAISMVNLLLLVFTCAVLLGIGCASENVNNDRLLNAIHSNETPLINEAIALLT